MLNFRRRGTFGRRLCCVRAVKGTARLRSGAGSFESASMGFCGHRAVVGGHRRVRCCLAIRRNTFFIYDVPLDSQRVQRRLECLLG